MTIDGATFIVEVADTPASRRLGLGGRESLGADRGMWFELAQTREASFWMRGMRIPIDIVWVTEELVVAGVAADLPPPSPGTSDADLPRYSSGAPVRYVLEINAGLAAELGIGPGDRVTVGGQ